MHIDTPWRAVGAAGYVGLSLLAACAIAIPPTAARSIDIGDIGSITRIRSPQVAPDGRSVVIVASVPDYDENRNQSRLVRVDVASGKQRDLTFNRRGVRRPRFSLSGDRLAFLAVDPSGETPRSQVFVLPLQGGEAQRVTSDPQGVVAYEWAGAQSLVYVAPLPVDEPDPTDPERHNKAFVVTHHDYLATEPPPVLHVFSVDLEGGEPRRVTGDDVVVAGGILQSLASSRDGSLVAFTGFPADRPGDLHRSELWVLDIASGDRRFADVDLRAVSWGAFAPANNRLAYSRPDDGVRWFKAHHLFVTGNNAAPSKVTAALDRTFYSGVWLPDGRSMLVGAHDGGRRSLWQQPLEGAPRKLDLGNLNLAVGLGGAAVHVASQSRGIAFIASESQRPAELYWLDSPRSRPRRLTNYNDAIAQLDLGHVEEVVWETADGFRANGMLTYPPGFDPERKYPLVLSIHGGPMSATTAGFNLRDQILAARGWLVFGPNYRGSSNLGSQYQAAVIGDAGAGPGRDVMAGLALLQSRGYVDASRIGVSGWSYGGYMTSWLIGNYPDVWRAALAGAPVTDYVDQYSLSDVNTGFGWGFTTGPWSPEGQASWREQSPIAHVHRATAPTLILCDTGDLRVPITESYKLFHALNDRDVPVQFVAYPVAGHFPGDPVHVRDVFRRWADWFEQRFARPRDAPVQ